MNLPTKLAITGVGVGEGIGEAQRPARAMRTKARDGFIRALRDPRSGIKTEPRMKRSARRTISL
jgi:hypothetical protein